MTPRPTRRPRATARPRSSSQMLEQGYLTRPRTTKKASSRRCPRRRTSRRPSDQTGRRHRRRLLHQLGAAAGDRTLRRPARLRRRPADQDHARPRTAARRRTGDRRLPRRPRRPHRGAGGDRKLHRRGARDGGRAQLRRKPVQPRHRGRAPARLLLQGVRPRGGAARTASRRTRCGPRKQKIFIVPGTHGTEKFVVHNDEGAYTGSNTLTGATAFSDNSIYAEVGLKVGTHRIARLAHRMGITTPISTNPAMTIGGLTVGVTPLDMAHAYETIAHGGRARQRHAGRRRRARRHPGSRRRRAQPLPDGAHRDVNQRADQARAAAGRRRNRDLDARDGAAVRHRARPPRIGQFAAGKTGTTSNYGDAWFVGWDTQVHGRRVGRLPQQADPDDHRLQRQPGARRHLPGADLARLHDLRAADRQGHAPNTRAQPPRRRAARRRRQRAGAAGAGAAGTDAGGDRRAARPTARRSPAPAATGGERRRRASPGSGDGGAGRARNAAPNRAAPRPRPPRPPQRSARAAPARSPAPAAPAATAARHGRRRADRRRQAERGAAPAARGPRPRDVAVAGQRRSASGSSTALVMPMRVPDDDLGLAATRPRAARMRDRARRAGRRRSPRARCRAPA